MIVFPMHFMILIGMMKNNCTSSMRPSKIINVLRNPFKKGATLELRLCLMSENFYTRDNCRYCKSKELVEFLDLGINPIK